MLLGVGLLVLVVVFVGVSSHNNSSNRTAGDSTAPAAVEASQAIPVTAPKLWADYHANEVAADNIYKGKQLLVKGVVTSINKDFTDSVYLSLSTLNEFESVHADIKSDYVAEAANLSIGQVVTVNCAGGGMIMASPILRDCSIQPNAPKAGTPVPEPQPQPQVSQVSNIPNAPPTNVETSTTPSNEITMPTLISQVPAEYSEEARRDKLNGTVKLVLTVDEEGNPQNVMVAKSLGMGLDESAVEAVKHYRFKPAVDQRTGKPVTAQMSVNVDFRLQ
jgi:TonB family protein